MTPQQPPSGSPPPSGILARWQQAIRALSDYLQAHARLFAAEAGHAGKSIVGSIILLLTAILAVGIAYLLLVVALVSLLVHQWDWSVATAAASVGGLHLVGAAILIAVARRLISQSSQWFAHSRREFSRTCASGRDQPSDES